MSPTRTRLPRKGVTLAGVGEDGPLFIFLPNSIDPDALTNDDYDRIVHDPPTYADRKARAPGHATPEQVAARVAFYGGACWLCRELFDQIDHVKPLARGGSNWPANLRPACRSCNASKGATWPLAAVR